MKKLLIALFLILLPSLAFAQCLDKEDGFETDFDYCIRGTTGCTTTAYDWAADSTSNYTAGTRSSDFAREETYSLKINHTFESGHSDWRCEYQWWDGGDSMREIAYGEEVWLSFSIYFPSDWTAPSTYDYLIFQFMQDRDYADGDPFSGPPMAIAVEPSGKMQFRIRGDANLTHTIATLDTNLWDNDIGTITPGAWHDFVLHVDEFNYDATNTVELWVRIGTGDWVKAIDETNRNTAFNNSTAYCQYGYFKFGVYTWAWNTTYYPAPSTPTPSNVTLYFDGIKLDDDGVCTFDDMVPDALPALTGTITTPTSDATYATTSATVTLEGTSTGASSVSYTNSAGGSGGCTGTDTWSCADIALSNGVNSIVVTFTGAAETNEDTIAVTRYANVTDDTTLTTTGGAVYINWQGTNGATVKLTASVDAASTSCDSFRVRLDTDPGTSDFYCWDTITTTGYETDTVSIRGNCDYTCADYDPYYITISSGYHVLYFMEREVCVAVESITFDEYSQPAAPAAGKGLRYESGGHVLRAP